MKMSCHTSGTVFDRYIIVSKVDLKQDAEKMGKIFETTAKTATIEQTSRSNQNTDKAQFIQIR